MLQIAIVEDDPIQADALAMWITMAKHQPNIFHTSRAFFDALKQQHFDVLLLDWNLPDYHGGQIIKWVRENVGWHIPIMVVTAVDDEANVVNALRSGGDDYLVKPVKPMELLARVEVLLRRFQPVASVVIHAGSYEIDTSQRVIRVAGNPVELTQKEFDLACFLFNHPGKLLSRMHLLEKIWGLNADVDTRTVDTHMSRIRKKLQIGPEHGWQLQPVYGYGYRMEVVAPALPEA